MQMMFCTIRYEYKRCLDSIREAVIRKHIEQDIKNTDECSVSIDTERVTL